MAKRKVISDEIEAINESEQEAIVFDPFVKESKPEPVEKVDPKKRFQLKKNGVTIFRFAEEADRLMKHEGWIHA